MRKEEMLHYLQELGSELEREGLEGEIILTGGAVMTIVHDAREATKDIDALYEPKGDIGRLAKAIAERYDLPADWLNDAVKGFVSEDVETEPYARYGGLHVTTVTPEYLLAMKLMSSRYDTADIDDIRFLMDKLEIQDRDQAYAILEKYYPINRVPVRTMYTIDDILEERSMGQEKETGPDISLNL